MAQTETTHENQSETTTRSVGVRRLVVLHCYPELPGPERRECAVELLGTGEWAIAKYNEVIGKWNLAHDIYAPVSQTQVTQWAYLDELFAA